MEYEFNRATKTPAAAQTVRQEASNGECRSLHDQVVRALPPIGKKRSVASDFGVGPPPLLNY